MPETPITQGRLLRDWRADGLRVVETTHAPGLILAAHQHDHPAVTVVLAGGFDETVGTERYRCKPGLVLFKPAGHAHSNCFQHLSHSLILQFEGARQFPHAATFVAGDEARSIGLELRDEFVAGHDDAVATLAAELAGQVRRREFPADPEWMRTALDLLQGSFAAAIGLREAAAAAGVHPVHFARVFRRQQGCSVATWLRRRRVHESMVLLRRSRRSLAEIALAVGFCDQAHFTHAFRREVGLTPARYRVMAG